MRRFRALVRGLDPRTAVTWRPEQRAEAEVAGGWTLTDHLQAITAEQTNFVARAVIASIPQPRGRRKEPPKPLIIDRPGRQAKPKTVRPGDAARMMIGGARGN